MGYNMAGQMSLESSQMEHAHRIQVIFELLTSNPLAAMDRAIEALRDAREDNDSKTIGKLLNLFARACIALSDVARPADCEHPFDHLFSRAASASSRRQIAVALARLTVAYPEVETRPNISQRMIAFFDECFEDNLYRMAKIDKGVQTFIKVREVSSQITSLEREISETILRVTSIQDAATFRSAYFKKINSTIAKLVIHPFLPASLREERISNFFASVEIYSRSSGPSIVESYNQVKEGAAQLLQASSDVATHYSDIISRAIATRLIGIVTEDFLRTPFSKQAHLRLEIGDKKYPLQAEGAQFPLEIAVCNDGPGYAFDVVVRLAGLISDKGDVDVKDSQIDLGGIQPSQTLVDIPCKVLRGGDELWGEFECTWKNFDQTTGSTSAALEFKAQRTGIQWEEAEIADPYSLSPVVSVDQLVGRADISNRLLALTRGQTIESAFIRGQKRVGKTSIVKALQNRLVQLFPKDYIVVYLEAGDYIAHDGKQTIEMLGHSLCREVRFADMRFSHLEEPNFSGGLAPLNGFLQDALITCPECRMLFILDEFDELPLDLYRRGMVGDAFFRTIRSISNKRQFGFILVGSEKMEYVLSSQGDALNKFERFSVDYFDKQNAWADFQDLVRKPSAEYLDFSDSAISALYDACAGNPYFAKLICKALFASMIRKRDCYVSRRGIESAVETTLREIGSNSFAHFWQDGISEPPPRSEEISVARRKVLLSWADCMRKGASQVTGARVEEIINAAKAVQLSDLQVENELRDFERRQILVSTDRRYSAKVVLFGRWLIERGYQDIVTALLDKDALIQFKNQEEINRVKEEEIAKLISTWDSFLGQRVGVESVRVWLNQFKGTENQRSAFKILQALRFYSADLIRQKMREVHGIVTRQIVWQRKARQPKRRDLVVSAIGGLAHSGAEYARRYADENQIYPDNVVALEQIPELLQGPDSEIKGVILVDDFIGTGDTLSGEIAKFPATVRDALEQTSTPVFLLVVVGYTKGIKVVEDAISRAALNISLHVCDIIPSDESMFGNRAKTFSTDDERLRAKDMAYEYGVGLVPKAPLGYGDTQAAIVFENKIPNNCPPILWQETSTWKPLFRRT